MSAPGSDSLPPSSPHRFSLTFPSSVYYFIRDRPLLLFLPRYFYVLFYRCMLTLLPPIVRRFAERTSLAISPLPLTFHIPAPPCFYPSDICLRLGLFHLSQLRQIFHLGARKGLCWTQLVNGPRYSKRSLRNPCKPDPNSCPHLPMHPYLPVQPCH